MQGLKGVIAIVTILGASAFLGACDKNVQHEPLKVGSADTVIETGVRA